MKSSHHLRTGSKVVLNADLQTEGGRFWYEGTEGVVDAVWRKDGQERIYVKLDGTVLMLDKSVLEDKVKINHDHTHITKTYSVEDGPEEVTVPGHLTQVRFKVEWMSVSYVDGELSKVYVKGHQIKTDGQIGKSVHARTFFGDFPQWVMDFLRS